MRFVLRQMGILIFGLGHRTMGKTDKEPYQGSELYTPNNASENTSRRLYPQDTRMDWLELSFFVLHKGIVEQIRFHCSYGYCSTTH